MGRAFQAFLIVAVAIVSALVYSYREATSKTSQSIALLQQKVEQNDDDSLLSPQKQAELFSQMPPVVQSYLFKAIPDLVSADNVASVKRIKSLKLKQAGTMRLGDHKSNWIPFTATQYFSSMLQNLGFVWDAIVFVSQPIPTFYFSKEETHLDLPVTVQDVYVEGKGLLEARLLGVLPVAHLENSPDVNAGELMRWLAECFLFPTVFLPPLTQQTVGLLEWNNATITGDATNKARLSIKDPQSKQARITVTVQFDKETFLPISVVGMRAKASTDKYGIGGVSYTRWQGAFVEYSEVQGMLVPSKMNAGWWEGEKKLVWYFKGENSDFQYEYV